MEDRIILDRGGNNDALLTSILANQNKGGENPMMTAMAANGGMGGFNNPLI